jgi:hypothetical protein
MSSSAARQDSVDSSPELREHKKPKLDATSTKDKKRQPEQGSSGGGSTKDHTVSKTTSGRTTAYTLSDKDALNLKIVNKDPTSIVDKGWTFTNQAKAGESPKGDINPDARATYSYHQVFPGHQGPFYTQMQKGACRWQEMQVKQQLFSKLPFRRKPIR